MIHIDIDGKSPLLEWIEKAEALTQEIIRKHEEGDSVARDQLIEDNSNLWRKLEPWLRKLSSGKCWYSEAKDCAAYWHVDHFRPKKVVKDLDGNKSEGYWWLAFKWQNYRLAGSALNIPKSTKFPVRNGTTRAAGPLQDENDESPYLLDPVKEDDPGLLSFNEKGKVIPGDPNGLWNRDRAKVTIDILNLNYDVLVRARQVCWEECDRRANHVRVLMGEIQSQNSVTKNTQIRDGIRELRKMVVKSSQFSAVAATCIISQGVDWLTSQVLFP